MSVLALHSAQIGVLLEGVTVSERIGPGQVRTFRLHVPAGKMAAVVCRQVETDVELESGEYTAGMSEWGDEILFIPGAARPALLTVRAGAREPATGRVEVRYELRPANPVLLDAQAKDATAANILRSGGGDRIDAAASTLRSAVRIWASSGEGIREGHSLMLLGKVLEKPGRHAEADALYERAIRLFEEQRDVANWLAARKRWMNLSGGLGLAGPRANAHDLRDMLRQWEALGDRRGVLWIRSQLARDASTPDRLPEHRRLVALARNIGAPDWECRSLEVIAGLLTQERRYQEVLDVNRSLLEIRRNLRDRPGEAAASYAIGRTEIELGHYGEAMQALTRARDLRKAQGDLRAELAALDDMLLAAIRMGDGTAANRYFDQARLLIDDLEARHSRPSQHWGYDFGSGIWAVNSPSVPEEVKLRALAALDAHRGRFVSRDSTPRMKELQARIPEDAVLVEYAALFDSQTGAIWTLDRTGAAWHPLAQGTAAWARKAAVLMAEGPPADEQAARKALSDAMLAPIRALLRGKRRILLVPDERLAAVPLASLPDPNSEDGSLLGDHHEIVYLDSAHARLSAASRPRTPAAVELALITDPVHNHFDARLRKAATAAPAPEWLAMARATRTPDEKQALPRLLAADWEKHQIRESVMGPVRVLEGFEVTPANVRDALREARIVHITAHGMMDWDAPQRSGLVLSQYGPDGRASHGYLSFDEITGLDAGAELVVLAACQTAVGKPIGFQGTPSVATAFLRAGARRVLASLWKVDDRATAELMAEFYRGLLGPRKLAPGSALREAQSKLRASAEWNHPRYWSAFVLYGDWTPLP